MSDPRDATDRPESPGAPSGETRISSSPPRRARFYPGLIVALLAASGVYLLLRGLWATRGDDLRVSWKLYGGGAACGLVAISGWWLLVRASAAAAQGRQGVTSWIAFPLCVFGFLAMIPLLVLAVSPAARERLDPHDRIRARVVDDGWLEIVFPVPTWDGITGAEGLGRGKTVNLTLDDFPIPASYFEENPDSHRWTADGRRLKVNLRALQTRLELPAPEWVSVNAIVEARQILDRARLRIPQQRVPVER